MLQSNSKHQVENTVIDTRRQKVAVPVTTKVFICGTAAAEPELSVDLQAEHNALQCMWPHIHQCT